MCSVYRTFELGGRQWVHSGGLNNSSKCCDCYGPCAFGGPAVFCNISCLSHYI